jgi:hypothetical protein
MDSAEQLQEDSFLDRVITGEETLYYLYDPETKHQSIGEDRRIPKPKKSRMSKSKIKKMFICFFGIRGIIHSEFVPEGTTVNQTFYMEVAEKLIDAVRHKRGEL